MVASVNRDAGMPWTRKPQQRKWRVTDMETLGWYVTCDDAVGVECAPAGFADGDYRAWLGFKGWGSPIEITDGAESEADSPTHCHVCEALIPHRLTREGCADVAERLREHLDGNGGRAEIQRAWFDAYGDGLDDETRELALAAIARGELGD
jgi:hypothetical protein